MEKFEDFCEKNSKDGGFLQSEHWKNFQESLGRKTFLINEDFFKWQMIFYQLPVVEGYFIVPRGPILNVQTEKSKIHDLFNKIFEEAKKNKAGWIRIEPQSQKNLNLMKRALGKKFKIVKSKKNHEPAQTLMIDLKPERDAILAQMKSKTRYNIRLATKKGVDVFSSRKANHVDKFIELTKTTARRDQITPHPDEYYRKMIESVPDDILKLYFAKYENKVISAIMVSYYGKVATYLHGASSNEHRNAMAPFILQWKAMQDAKAVGCKKYDLGGTKINKDGTFEKSWAGITRFKRGFCPGCKPVGFPGCWDIVLDNKRYYTYRLLQSLKDLKMKQ